MRNCSNTFFAWIDIFADDTRDFSCNILYIVIAISANVIHIADMAQGGTVIIHTVSEQLPEGIFTRQQILNTARHINPSFKDTQLRYLIGSLMDFSKIARIGHNQYQNAERAENRVFIGSYSQTASQVIRFMQEQFPLLKWQIWEFHWLNDFFNHLVAHNQILLDIEKDGCQFVFSALRDTMPGSVLLTPTAREMERYGVDDGIIIGQLITEAPRCRDGEAYQVPLEKLIVDLFANTQLPLARGDYALAFEAMFSAYQIDQVKMFRYARRRNKANALRSFLTEHTTIPV